MAFIPKNICTHNTEQNISAKKTFSEGLSAKKVTLLDGTELKAPAIETFVDYRKNRLLVATGPKSVTTTDDIIIGNTFITFAKPVKAKRFIGSFTGPGDGITHLQAQHLEGPFDPSLVPLDNECLAVVDKAITVRVDPDSSLVRSPEGLTIDFNNFKTSFNPGSKEFVFVFSPATGMKKIPVTSFMGLINEMNNKIFNMVTTATSVGRGASLLKGAQNKGRNRELQFKTIKFDENFIVEESENDVRVSLKRK